MARIRSSQLEKPTPRLRFPVSKKPIFVPIADGLSLGYRRNRTAGTWVMRLADGRGGASTQAIAHADDFEPSDGTYILNFWEAQEECRKRVRGGAKTKEVLTVGKAVENYLEWLAGQSSMHTARDTRLRLERLFLPHFADSAVSGLSKTGLDRWLRSLVATRPDEEKTRRSKDTANRILGMVKASLNHALRDPSNDLKDDTAWRLVRPFPNVAKPRETHFTMDQVRTLLKVADERDPAFADLLRAAILTGARYGELTACLVGDFDGGRGTLTINKGKTGRRLVVLQTEAIAFFKTVQGDRNKEAPLLMRTDGCAWKSSQQTRRMKDYAAAANLPSSSCFYSLRHTYISRAIEGGVPLIVIADNCGTSIRMIETNYAKILTEDRRAFIEKGAPSLGAGGAG